MTANTFIRWGTLALGWLIALPILVGTTLVAISGTTANRSVPDWTALPEQVRSIEIVAEGQLQVQVVNGGDSSAQFVLYAGGDRFGGGAEASLEVIDGSHLRIVASGTEHPVLRQSPTLVVELGDLDLEELSVDSEGYVSARVGDVDRVILHGREVDLGVPKGAGPFLVTTRGDVRHPGIETTTDPEQAVGRIEISAEDWGQIYPR